MTSSEWPEADALEQRRPVLDDDEEAEAVPEVGTEVDPADALEQWRPAGDVDEDYPGLPG